MQITDNKVVSIHYTLTNDAGEKLDSSAGGEPLTYLHGAGNIIPGLEDALTGKETGDKFTATIEAENAYGEKHPEMIQVVPKSMFEGMDVEPGMQFQAQANHGPSIITVLEVKGEEVTIDGNHPLAGEALTFDVEVADVRDATKEELEHGHVHGEGGHQH